MRRLLTHFILMAAVAMSVLVAPSGATAASASCANIKDFKIAQIMLNKGHSHLDSDRDGIACESWIVKTPAKGEPSKTKQGKALYRWTYWTTSYTTASNYNIAYRQRWNNLLAAYYDGFAAPLSKNKLLRSNMQTAQDMILAGGSHAKYVCLRNNVLAAVKRADNNKSLHKDVQKLFGTAQKAARGVPGVAQIVKNYMNIGKKLASAAANVADAGVVSKMLSLESLRCGL